MPIRKPQRLMVGCHHSPVASNKLAAAKPLFGKAVFCVDNVSPAVTDEELESYVKSLSVRVISCHKVKPRRTYKQKRDNIYPNDHNTFRLCIYKADSNLLLNPEVWPDDISISTYYFKPKKSDDQSKQRDEQPMAAGGSTSDHGTTESARYDNTADNHSDDAVDQSPVTPTVQSPITPTAAGATSSDMESTLLGEQAEISINQNGC
jgi:hypothetical protein